MKETETKKSVATAKAEPVKETVKEVVKAETVKAAKAAKTAKVVKTAEKKATTTKTKSVAAKKNTVTAEISINAALVFVAISLASVVFPHPGVPHKINENNLLVFNKFNSGLREDITLLCPKKSSKVLGLKISAKGICLF